MKREKSSLKWRSTVTGQGAIFTQRIGLVLLTTNDIPMAHCSSFHALTLVGSYSAKVYTPTSGSVRQDQRCLQSTDLAACITGV